MKFTVDKIEACEPISRLLTTLIERGFMIVENRVGDFHFNELYFFLRSGKNDLNLNDIRIEKIGRHSDNKFYCECHWSVVEVGI